MGSCGKIVAREGAGRVGREGVPLNRPASSGTVGPVLGLGGVAAEYRTASAAPKRWSKRRGFFFGGDNPRLVYFVPRAVIIAVPRPYCKMLQFAKRPRDVTCSAAHRHPTSAETATSAAVTSTASMLIGLSVCDSRSQAKDAGEWTVRWCLRMCCLCRFLAGISTKGARERFK